MSERILTQEQEAKKETWLKDLSSFIFNANAHILAGEGFEVTYPDRPGYREIRWPHPDPETGKVKGDWEMVDGREGDFRGGNEKRVCYKGETAWRISYGGTGVTPGEYSQSESTLSFLNEALEHATIDEPIRGPKKFRSRGWVYEKSKLGTLEDFDGSECIFNEIANRKRVFCQLFFGGITINKDSNGNPVYPWDR